MSGCVGRTGRLRAAVTAVGAVALLAMPAPAASAGPAVPTLNWVACGDGLHCATATVPLDYADPSGASTTLSLTQLPATDPAHRIGTVFLGAPGAVSGATYLQYLSAGVTDAVRARFDLVSFDRRGLAGSAPVRCFATGAEEDAFVAPLPYFPVGAAEVTSLDDVYQDYARQCAQRNGTILPHVSSTDVAQDLDLLRRAVGDERLNYVGYSWSAYVGAIYANLYPDRVRAMVYDGPQYEPDFATGAAGTTPFSRTNSDLGAEEALQNFFADCRSAGAPACPFAAGGDPAVKFDRLATRLAHHPVPPPLPGGPTEFGYDDLIGVTANALLSGDQYASLAQTLQDLYTGAMPAGLARPTSAIRAQAGPFRAVANPDEQYSNNTFDAFTAFACADLDRPHDVWQTDAAARARLGAAPHFGAFYAWYVGPCATWSGPQADRYTGPWRNTGGLVVGMRYDPIAWYSGVTRFADLIGARLVTVTDGRGHLSLGNSTCAAEATSAYLLNPATGGDLDCTADRQPF